jgi:hypothetical protein
MREIGRWSVRGATARTLVWDGEDLVDPAGGWSRFKPDGTWEHARVRYAFPFDQAIRSPSGRYTAICVRRGTKALLLDGQSIVRELNRSFYLADAYEYPIALGRLPDGQEVVAHCPERYNALEIELLETGERLAQRTANPMDFFHSRLQISSDGRYLLSAGWIWHPVEGLLVFDLQRALSEPASLDRDALFTFGYIGFEIEAASFSPGGVVVLATSDALDELDDDYDEFTGGIGPREVVRYSPAERKILSRARVSEPVGTIMPVGQEGEWAVGFFEHPKLFDTRSGEVIARWSDLSTGRQAGSIVHGIEPPPPLALDPDGHRFAVGGSDGITAILLG